MLNPYTGNVQEHRREGFEEKKMNFTLCIENLKKHEDIQEKIQERPRLLLLLHGSLLRTDVKPEELQITDKKSNVLLVVHFVSPALCFLSFSLRFFDLVGLTSINHFPIVQSFPSSSQMNWGRNGDKFFQHCWLLTLILNVGTCSCRLNFNCAFWVGLSNGINDHCKYLHEDDFSGTPYFLAVSMQTILKCILMTI